MSTPLIQAFFVGRAIAEVLYERAEETLTHTLSELGKFDAEQREHLRSFVDEVMERANREAQAATQAQSSTPMGSIKIQTDDLQATIDDLRAEIAELRSELQRYRSQSNPAS